MALRGAVLVLACSVSACSGDGGPSRSEFARAADRICDTTQARLDDLDQPNLADASSVESFAEDAARLATRELEQLRELEPPDERDDIESFFADFARQIRVLDRAAREAEDAEAVQEAVGALDTAGDSLQTKAKKIGFRRCGREIADIAGAVKGGVDVRVNDLRLGDCFNEHDEESDQVVVVACAQNHTGEVFATTEMEAAPDAAFPGDDAIKSFADQYCGTLFNGYVGKPFSESTLSGYFFRPSAETWPDGDRTVVCVLTNKDELPRTGSARGANI